MKKMIWLHQDGELVLVNPDQIQTVHRNQSGSHLYLSGWTGALKADEDQDLIYAMIRDAYR